MWTISSRLGYCKTFHRPSSRLSLCAAKLKRADCASQGLISCARETVFICSPNYDHDASWPRRGLEPQANLQILDIGKGGSKLKQRKQRKHHGSPKCVIPSEAWLERRESQA